MIRAVMNDGVDEVEGNEVETTADAGLAGVVDCSQVGETSIVRVPCCEPGDQESHTIATVYVRAYVESLSPDPLIVKWESLGILNGEELFHEANYALRKYAIEDAVRTLAAEAADSTSRSDKLAAKFILAYLQEIETAEGDAGPEGEPSEWPAFAGAEGAMEGEPEIEDASVPLAGEGEIVGGEEQSTTPQASEAPAELPATDIQPTTPPTRTPAERNAAARADFEHRLAIATDELVQASIDNKHAQEVAKSAKARLKAATDEIARLGEKGPKVMPLFDRANATGKFSDVKQDSTGAVTATLTLGGEPTNVTVNADNPQASASDPAPAAADAWRSRPTSELGLPPKLIEKLADNGIETIGALEDQRAAFKGLRGIKGIGEAKADAIEDAVLAWLSKNRDAWVVVG